MGNFVRLPLCKKLPSGNWQPGNVWDFRLRVAVLTLFGSSMNSERPSLRSLYDRCNCSTSILANRCGWEMQDQITIAWQFPTTIGSFSLPTGTELFVFG